MGNSEVALLRDANSLGDLVSSEELTPCVCPQHIAQYHKLEKLIKAQKEFSIKTKQVYLFFCLFLTLTV